MEFAQKQFWFNNPYYVIYNCVSTRAYCNAYIEKATINPHDFVPCYAHVVKMCSCTCNIHVNATIKTHTYIRKYLLSSGVDNGITDLTTHVKKLSKHYKCVTLHMYIPYILTYIKDIRMHIHVYTYLHIHVYTY